MINFDGHLYETKADAPDLGSIRCIAYEGNVREYRGLSKDASKLPVYNDLGQGSSCLMQDTGDYYEFNAVEKRWIKM